MSNEVLQKRREHFSIDRYTALMVGLVVAIQGLSVAIAPRLAGLVALPETQMTDATLGIWMVAILVVETIVIVVLYRLWKRLPDWLRKYGKYAIILSLYGLYGWMSYEIGEFGVFLQLSVVLSVWLAISRILKRFGMDWMAFDLFSIGFGVCITAFAGLIAAPIVIIPLMVAMLVWDHVAVNLSDVMGDLIEFSSSSGIPNVIIIPSGLRLDFEKAKEYIKDTEANERPENLLAIIGVGDFVIPGSLTVSAWASGFETVSIITLIGTCVAMVVLHNALENSETGLPALPWLNTGALIGFGVGTLVAGVSIMTVVGL